MEPPSSVLKLGHLLDVLGSGIATLVSAPSGLDVAITEAVIYDPVVASPLESGYVVLAVGTSPVGAGAADLAARAGAAHAAAVVLKLNGHPPAALADVAHRSDVAILGVPTDMSWGTLYMLVHEAVASGLASRETVATRVPVGDLFGLANAIAAMVGGAALIEDPQGRVLAYSSLDEEVDAARRAAILGRKLPDKWRKRITKAGWLAQLWSAQTPVRFEGFPQEGIRPRLAIAVRVGSEIIGSIWVAEGAEPFAPGAEAALQAAADVAALHLIRRHATEQLERNRRGELLRLTLEGQAPDERTLGPRLGLDADSKSSFAVIAFAPASEGPTDEDRILDLISVYYEAFRRRAASVAIGGTVYSLILLRVASEEKDRLMNLAESVVNSVRSAVGVSLVAGVGSVVELLGDVPRSRVEADRALRVVRSDPRRAAAHIDDVLGRAILLELREAAAGTPERRLGKLSALAELDRKRGTDYVASLRAYLDCLGHIPVAAKRLGVHRNTFRYRMRRIFEVTGLDLDDPEERLATEVLLRLL